MSMPAGAAEGKPRIIEMRRIQLRNTQDAMSRRTQDFLEKAYVPALKRRRTSRRSLVLVWWVMTGTRNCRAIL